MTLNEPQHIRRAWWPVAARMQQVAARQKGTALLSIVVVVDQNGDPIFWREPELTPLEPISKGELIQKLLTGP